MSDSEDKLKVLFVDDGGYISAPLEYIKQYGELCRKEGQQEGYCYGYNDCESGKAYDMDIQRLYGRNPK